jgi:hypothetical protein
MMAARIWRVTWTFLGSISKMSAVRRLRVPKPSLPDISGILLLKKGADLLQLAATCRSVVEEVAQLRGHGLDLLHRLLVFGVAFQHQDLMLGTAFLLRTVDGTE